MIDCPNGDIRDLLPDLLHDRLDADVRGEVEAHLRGCEPCRQELELLRGMKATLRRVPAIDLDAVVAAIPPYRPAVGQRPVRTWGGWRIAAAVTLLAVGGGSVVVARRGTVAPAPAAIASVAVASAAPRELALTGGAIGELDDTELSTLIDDVGSLNAVTPADLDNAATAGPIAPSSPGGLNN